MGNPFTATSKAADAPEIDPGIYDARFDGVDVKFIKGGNFGDGDRFEWQFTLVDDDKAVIYDKGEPLELTGLTSMSLNIASKTTPRAVRYLKALMTKDEFAKFEAGAEDRPADTDLVGRIVQVEVALKESNGWPTIADVLPARKKPAARPKPAAADVEED